MLDCHMSFCYVNNLESHTNLRLIIYNCIADMAYCGESVVCLTVLRNSSLGDFMPAIAFCMLFWSRVEVFIVH